MTKPAEEGFFMPAEWAPHTRCWMAWPCREDLWGEDLEAARDAFAEVAKAIAAFEPVTMVANPESVAEVSLKCGSGVATLPLEHNDSWLRDNGPIFVIDGKGGIAGIDWRFNGYGERFRPYDKDAQLAEAILGQLGVRRFAGPLVLEGGALQVDGEGTLIAVKQTILNENRNPGLTQEKAERTLGDYLGAKKVIWLEGALEDDHTDGHVDNLVAFLRPGAVVALSADDKTDSNYEALQANLEVLRSATDAAGRALQVSVLEQPKAQRGKDGKRLALSYVNFYRANGGLVIPAFEDPADDSAFELFEELFPDLEIVQLPALDILRGGGGIHCITQQQPRAEPESA